MSSRSGGPRSPEWRYRPGRAAEPEGRRRSAGAAPGARAGWNAPTSAALGHCDDGEADGGRDRRDAGGRSGGLGHDDDAGQGAVRRPSRSQGRDKCPDQGGGPAGLAPGGGAAGRESDDEHGSGHRARSEPSAYGKALGLLARREYSGRELKRKLSVTGYGADEAAEALNRLREQSFQSDDRFAGLLVRSRVAQGQGPRRIRAELRSHGIDDAAAQQALIDEGADWLVLARQIYRRRYGSGAAADRQETQRRAAFLLRRGFDAATVRAITHADDVDDSAEEFD